MEILINKTGREYLDWTETKNSIAAMNLPRFCYVEEKQSEDFDLAYFCRNCGSHLQGKWKHQYLTLYHVGHACTRACKDNHDCTKVNAIIEEFNEKYSKPIRKANQKELLELARLTHCPVCGAELKRCDGYFFAKISGSSKDDPLFSKVERSHYAYMCYARPRAVQNEQEEHEKKVEQFVLACDVPALSSTPADYSASIATSPTKLKEYLQHLIEMEIGIYSLTSRLKTLYIQQETCRQNVVASKHLPLFTKRNDLEVAESILYRKIQKAKQYMNGETGITPPAKPIPPVLGTPNLFNKKRVLAENEVLQANYQADLNAYKDELRQYEAKVNFMISNAKTAVQQAQITVEKLKEELLQLEHNSNLSLLADSAKKIVDNEIEQAESALRKLFECRNKLYGYNIVFGKYRNVVALSTFYEYLMAGRCTSLDGTNGAYNLYENEIRANMIIGQLSQVISKLEEIKEAQYMIYSELKTVNKHLDHLNQTMDTALTSIQSMEKSLVNISENTNVIAHNTAVTAYYSKVNAELANALGFMMALR